MQSPISSGDPIRLDLGCGQSKREGYLGVDWASAPGVDYQVNLDVVPWPWLDGSVDAIFTSHVVEHVKDLVSFMNESARVLRQGGEMEIRHPYCKNTRAFQDPTHVRFIPEQTWLYFNADWRKANKLDHYPITADFEIVLVAGDGISDSIAHRSADAQAFAREHYWNVIADLVVKLKKR